MSSAELAALLFSPVKSRIHGQIELLPSSLILDLRGKELSDEDVIFEKRIGAETYLDLKYEKVESEGSKQFDISFRFFQAEEDFFCRVSPSTRVGKLMEVVEKKFGLEPLTSRLIFEGKRMGDYGGLADFSMKDGDAIFVFLEQTGCGCGCKSKMIIAGKVLVG